MPFLAFCDDAPPKRAPRPPSVMPIGAPKIGGVHCASDTDSVANIIGGGGFDDPGDQALNSVYHDSVTRNARGGFYTNKILQPNPAIHKLRVSGSQSARGAGQDSFQLRKEREHQGKGEQCSRVYMNRIEDHVSSHKEYMGISDSVMPEPRTGPFRPRKSNGSAFQDTERNNHNLFHIYSEQNEEKRQQPVTSPIAGVASFAEAQHVSDLIPNQVAQSAGTAPRPADAIAPRAQALRHRKPNGSFYRPDEKDEKAWTNLRVSVNHPRKTTQQLEREKMVERRLSMYHIANMDKAGAGSFQHMAERVHAGKGEAKVRIYRHNEKGEFKDRPASMKDFMKGLDPGIFPEPRSQPFQKRRSMGGIYKLDNNNKLFNVHSKEIQSEHSQKRQATQKMPICGMPSNVEEKASDIIAAQFPAGTDEYVNRVHKRKPNGALYRKRNSDAQFEATTTGLHPHSRAAMAHKRRHALEQLKIKAAGVKTYRGKPILIRQPPAAHRTAAHRERNEFGFQFRPDAQDEESWGRKRGSIVAHRDDPTKEPEHSKKLQVFKSQKGELLLQYE